MAYAGPQSSLDHGVTGGPPTTPPVELGGPDGDEGLDRDVDGGSGDVLDVLGPPVVFDVGPPLVPVVFDGIDGSDWNVPVGVGGEGCPVAEGPELEPVLPGPEPCELVSGFIGTAWLFCAVNVNGCAGVPATALFMYAAHSGAATAPPPTVSLPPSPLIGSSAPPSVWPQTATAVDNVGV